jgi:signal peptidase I
MPLGFVSGKRVRKNILIVGLVLVALCFGALVCYRFLFLHFVRVPTASMANTVLPGDHLVVKKRAFGEINRGDLIVFRYPADPGTYYLARVIGLPGETLEVRDRILFINGKQLMEQRVTVAPDVLFDSDHLEELSSEGSGSYRVFYQANDDSIPRDDSKKGPFPIPMNEYFVMGDNRDNSEDSRYRGTVPREFIFGKPFMIYWSSKPDRQGGEARWDRVATPVK